MTATEIHAKLTEGEPSFLFCVGKSKGRGLRATCIGVEISGRRQTVSAVKRTGAWTLYVPPGKPVPRKNTSTDTAVMQGGSSGAFTHAPSPIPEMRMSGKTMGKIFAELRKIKGGGEGGLLVFCLP